jgi:hypothetical protein
MAYRIGLAQRLKLPEQIAAIQRERDAAVQTYAVKLTEDIVGEVALVESPPGSIND